MAASTDQTMQFLDGFLIFLSLPTYGKLRKIKKPSKNCIVWSVEAAKVKGIQGIQMADASRGPGRPPKKRSGSKKAENVPGAKLQKSQREKGRRVRKYLMEQSKVREQGTEQGEKSL